MRMHYAVNWSAAVCAGIVAGVLSTVVQISLWSVFSDALPTLLFRDARLAAAIVMGRGVLPPPASFDWSVILVATLIHVALSIAYGLILSWVISGLGAPLSLLAGAMFGLFVYVINMYGFTTVFPWFEAARDWITVVAHLAFGIVAAAAYKLFSPTPD